MATYQAGVPTDAERNNGDFGEVCPRMAERSMTRACAPLRRARSGIRTSASYRRPHPTVQVAQEPIGALSSRINNVGAYTSPGNPKLNGTPYQLSGGPGDLIDPVAQTMMKMFPEPTLNMAEPDHLRQLDRLRGQPLSKRPVRHQDRPSIQRKEFDEREVFPGVEQPILPSTASDNFIDPCAGGTNKGTAHLFTINDTYTFVQPCC